jgi:23S rRNA (uracil1939-C5)-methyltransferase
VKKRKERIIIPGLEISGYAAEGKALAKHDGKVIFVSGAVPGDRADILLTKNKKDWAEGRAIHITHFSQERTEPFCGHFGVCGGCKWQMLPYKKQLEFKQQEAVENLRRIGKIGHTEIVPILGADDDRFYRNKLEFTFSNKEYLTSLPEKASIPDGSDAQKGPGGISNRKDSGEDSPPATGGALGFHAPRIFDKAIDISTCYLMDDVNNLIRNAVRRFSLENKYSFYDARLHTGWLRNIVIRLAGTGELMVNIIFNYEAETERKRLLDFVLKTIPSITTLLYTLNPKWNDSIHDLVPRVYSGEGFITEKLGSFYFKISAKSFFQTNTKQAEKLYGVVLEMAALSGTETVYDLYCGTGSIGIFISKEAKKIIGVEINPEAIEDARVNAALNEIQQAYFFAGDVTRICNDAFFEAHGRPDVIITDPPRAGMHEKLVLKLLEMRAPKIIYVSCNTATQARDIALLSERYTVEKIQPVDMFPHTHHIECVALLKLKP